VKIYGLPIAERIAALFPGVKAVLGASTGAVSAFRTEQDGLRDAPDGTQVIYVEVSGFKAQPPGEGQSSAFVQQAYETGLVLCQKSAGNVDLPTMHSGLADFALAALSPWLEDIQESVVRSDSDDWALVTANVTEVSLDVAPELIAEGWFAIGIGLSVIVQANRR
jgi:hypothetical protein